MTLELKSASLTELKEKYYASPSPFMGTSATSQLLETRKVALQGEGNSGIMWYATTYNMKKAANKLRCTCQEARCKRQHRQSPAQEAKGYVWVIQRPTLIKQSTTQADLKKKASNTDRVGATVDIESRRGDYERKGYSGVMWYAKTRNMKRVEDELLSICKEGESCPANKQRISNVPAEPGYVYVIV